MEFSPELKNLIDASLADGKITKNEKKVLVNRAIKEGHDENEFLLHLDSLKSLNNSTSTGVVDKIKPLLNWVVAKKRRVILAFFVVATVLQLVVVILDGLYQGVKDSSLANERGCENVDDCLTSYRFSEARLYAAELTYGSKEQLRGIISAEVSYYIAEDAIEMAIRSLREYKFEDTFRPQGWSGANDDYNEEVAWFNSVIVQAISETTNNRALQNKLVVLLKPIARIGASIEEDRYSFEEDFTQKEKVMSDI